MKKPSSPCAGSHPSRREVLRTAGAVGLTAALPGPRARAAVRSPRFVLVLLRGGLDGLAAVRPIGDPDFFSGRGALAEDRLGLPLDGFFAMHPSLTGLAGRFAAGEALILHAAATSYRGCSHDEALVALEGGGPGSAASGWLNRAVAAAADDASADGALLVLCPSPPLAARGPAPAVVCDPRVVCSASPETVDRILRRRDGSPAPVRIAAAGLTGGTGDTPERVAALAAHALRAEDGPRVAILPIDGFDTHADQASRLAGRLAALDRVIATLRQRLAAGWSDTVVIVASEFGRSVETNGARGTEHGLATAAFLVGGAVRGGRVVADWPGLAPSQLENGALAATTDLRAALMGVLRDHWGLSTAVLKSEVFPDSGPLRPMAGLLR